MEEKQKEVEEMTPIQMLIGLIAMLVMAFWIWSSFIAEETQTTSTPIVATESSRCLAVPESLAQRLNDGLNITGGGSVTNLQAVKSNDFGSVYFVSGKLNGSGLGRDTDLVTFLTNKLDNSGLTFSVDSVSTEFSDWPNITTTNLLGTGVSKGMVMVSDGYDESRECVSSS